MSILTQETWNLTLIFIKNVSSSTSHKKTMCFLDTGLLDKFFIAHFDLSTDFNETFYEC